MESDIPEERRAQSCVIMRAGTKYYKQYPPQRLQFDIIQNDFLRDYDGRSKYTSQNINKGV